MCSINICYNQYFNITQYNSLQSQYYWFPSQYYWLPSQYYWFLTQYYWFFNAILLISYSRLLISNSILLISNSILSSVKSQLLSLNSIKNWKKPAIYVVMLLNIEMFLQYWYFFLKTALWVNFMCDYGMLSCFWLAHTPVNQCVNQRNGQVNM